MARFHLYHPVRNESGDLLSYARVTIYNEDGSLYEGTLYRDATTGAVYNNPYIVAPALITLYLDGPARIVLGIADTDGNEAKLPVEEVSVNAEEIAYGEPFTVTGDMPQNGILRAKTDEDAYWHLTGMATHDHGGFAPGSIPLREPVVPFPGAISIGYQAGASVANSPLDESVAYGWHTKAVGEGNIALGYDTYAGEGLLPPWKSGSIAIGNEAIAQADGIAIGDGAKAWEIEETEDLSQTLSIGRDAEDEGPQALSLGAFAHGQEQGISIGYTTGSASNGGPGSIGVGAQAQFGLPSSPEDVATLLGAYNPAAAVCLPWTNPDFSQSESPLAEDIHPEMSFTGTTLQFQRGLELVIDGLLETEGGVTLAGKRKKVGFYGSSGTTQPSVGPEELDSGIPALNSLIYALRDLGLLKARKPALAYYVASDVQRHYNEHDEISIWPEHSGKDLARSRTNPPELWEDQPTLNGYATVHYNNPIYGVSSWQPEDLRAETRIGEAKHVIAAGRRSTDRFHNSEGMVNLIGDVCGSNGVPKVDQKYQMLTGSHGWTWSNVNVGYYSLDGWENTQSRNAMSNFDAHVFHMMHPSVWPIGRLNVGGPRYEGQATTWDSWCGSIAEISVVDDSWSLTDAQSLARGLAIKYNTLNENDYHVAALKDYLITRQDTFSGAILEFDQDWQDDTPAVISGTVKNYTESIIAPIPWISIYSRYLPYSYSGMVAGQWAYLPGGTSYDDYWIELYTLPNATEWYPNPAWVFGYFPLNNNGTWTTGDRWVPGNSSKIARLVRKSDMVRIATNAGHTDAHRDTEMRLYTRDKDTGTLEVNDTVPLWGDKTWFGTIRNHLVPGEIFAEMRVLSTQQLLATSERLLPQDTDNPAETDVARLFSCAMAVMALSRETRKQFRAHHILRALAKTQKVDGSFAEVYSRANPATNSGLDVRSNLTLGLAVLAYTKATGNQQYLPMTNELADYLIANVSETADYAVLYFLLRDLGRTTEANAVKTTLLTTLWSTPDKRFKRSLTLDESCLEAHVWGGLFLHAIVENDKLAQTFRALRAHRVHGAELDGITGLVGYRQVPYYADPVPDKTIDYLHSLGACLLKLRNGSPAGTDLDSLLRWRNGSGQMSLRLTNEDAGHRQLSIASFLMMLLDGGQTMFGQELPVPPVVSSVTFTGNLVGSNYHTEYKWESDPTVPAAAFEAKIEKSTDGGTIWNPAAPVVRRNISKAEDLTEAVGHYRHGWVLPLSQFTENAQYRVQVRMRNRNWGSWVSSALVLE